ERAHGADGGAPRVRAPDGARDAGGPGRRAAGAPGREEGVPRGMTRRREGVPRMSDATPVLSYDGFDHALESERARWLRARFLWFCGVTFVLTFAMEAGPRWLARLADEPSLASGPIDLASSIASAAIAGTAFVVVL